MAKVVTKHVFRGNIKQVFKSLIQYNRYPEFLPGVQKIEVLPAKLEGSSCQIRYELNLVKTFYYVLNMFEKDPANISWTLEESNLMKVNNGSWDLMELNPDETEASYSLEVSFKGLVPGFVTDQIAKANLPLMFKGFERLLENTK